MKILPTVFLRALWISCICFICSQLLDQSPAHAAPRKEKAKQAKTSRTAQVSRRQRSETPLGPECKALFLVEPSSWTVIQEMNADEPLQPASMTKLMLAYVVLKKLKEGSVGESDLITISAHASRIGGSQVYLKEHEQFTLRELLDAVLIQSANDAATAIAEHIGGTSEGFVEMMNQEAQAIGMTEAKFFSPHGLPPGAGQQADRVSARNMARLGEALIKEYPQILQVTKQTDADFRGGVFHMSNHNHLLKTFPGCDGLKTGYFSEAGFNVTATAVRNNVRMIAVAMDCHSRKGRDKEVAKMLSVGLSQYRPFVIAEKGQTIGKPVPVSGGERDSVGVAPEATLQTVVRSGDEQKIIKKIESCDSLAAPVEPNAKCGSLAAYLGEKELGRVGLVASGAVGQIGSFGKIRAKLGF